jgi:hypothetical protein
MNPKYLKYINTLFVVIPMTILMAFVGIARTYGFGEGWLIKMMRAWIVMMPVAYVAAFFIIPAARRLSDRLIKW